MMKLIRALAVACCWVSIVGCAADAADPEADDEEESEAVAQTSSAATDPCLRHSKPAGFSDYILNICPYPVRGTLDLRRYPDPACREIPARGRADFGFVLPAVRGVYRC
jgi:hypothetical protein